MIIDPIKISENVKHIVREGFLHILSCPTIKCFYSRYFKEKHK